MMAMQRYAWEQGVAAQAMLESGEIEWATLLAREAVHRGVQDGRVAWMGNFPGITDPCSNGEAIGVVKDVTGDPIFYDAFQKLLQWALVSAPRNETGIIYHQESAPEFWVDSFYMLPPFLAYAGYYNEALKQIDGWWKALFDAQEGLLSHIWHDGEKTFTRKDFWGVGNGWAISGMSRVIAFLPEHLKTEKEVLVNRIKTILKSSVKFQRQDALFHDVINEPNSFVETNFAQMLAYTIYRGIIDKWLCKNEDGIDWLDIADNIRKAANAKVDSYGYVHGVCGAPDFSHQGYAVEGQAFFILMESAATKLGLADLG